jgi:ABC-2 type transport system permease protein
MFSNYPPVIFNTIAKILLFTIIPCGFMIFLPAESIFLGFSIWGIVAMLGFALLVTILAFILFKKGLKKYNSGSLMGGRL